jgi:chemotaxis protein CheD
MIPGGDELPRVHLGVSEVHIARTPALIETTLGSCVAAVFWSPRLRVGGMCHGALPRCPNPPAAECAHNLRYVDFAIRYLAERFQAFGLSTAELKVRLFGGADMLRVSTPRAAATVGRQNCVAAIEALEAAGIRPVTTDLGGLQGRVVYFRTDTGEIFLRRLRAIDAREDNRALPLLLAGEELP